MSAATFQTLTGEDWRRGIAEARAAENVAWRQIREELSSECSTMKTPIPIQKEDADFLAAASALIRVLAKHLPRDYAEWSSARTIPAEQFGATSPITESRCEGRAGARSRFPSSSPTRF
jgi:hypothetical protein